MRGPICAVLVLSAAAGCAPKSHWFVPSALGGRVAAGYGVRCDAYGRIAVAGVASDERGTFRPSVWRFDRSGRPDRGFGKGGLSALAIEGWAWSLDIDALRRPVAAGFSGNDWREAPAALILRLLADGTPDPSFGASGIRLLKSPFGGARAAAFCVAVSHDGSIIAAGSASDRKGAIRPVVWKLRPDGQPDSGFGTGGWLALRCPPGTREARAGAVLLQDGNIVVAGNVDWRRLAVWRLRSDGSEAGRILTPNGMGRGLLPAEGGGLWVAGFRYVGPEQREETVLTRLEASGRPDPGFATRGARILRRRGRRAGQEAFAMAAVRGRVLLAGYTGTDDVVRAAVWPFDSQGRPAGGVLELPGPEGGVEDRAYAITAAEYGGAWAAGLSKDPSGRRRLALWRVAIP
ncbi:MAG: hypothetical protein PHF00_02155 [Elusimicrobia bacterium]|nr:hypothetical protein [Elusimicrobiota bacterium]